MSRIATLAAACLAASSAVAQEGGFAADSEADSWGLNGEEKARFAARVVDVLCELTGDCPANCGDGARQLGLLRDADGLLVLAVKNGQPLFTGAAEDLLPFCDETIEVDGLLVGDPAQTAAKFYQVQRIRRLQTDEWSEADRWTSIWAEEHPDAARAEGPWYRNDPSVQALIEENGYLGLGPEAEEAFLDEWLE